MFLRFAHFVCFLFAFSLFLSCKQKTVSDSAGKTLFTLMPGTQTGIDFNNRIEDNNEMNILNYHNFYNGGGVAIGDINNDGKPDIFFTSNQHENKLYLNKGDWKFEDITVKAGIKSAHRWHTGVTMVDINGDGWLDIYVCNSGIANNDDRANELYINQKNGTFIEEAHLYGLDDEGESTQAVFFDYDLDGDLDCFILNNSHRSIESFGYDSKQRYNRDPNNGDRLYRNDGGRFTDVSAKANIYGSEIGFGLGIAVSDVNKDGWPDIYVCNDFFERDYLYINNRDGSFKEVITDAMGHISNGSMGCDIADINNDGWPDIFTAEMLPETDYRLKTTLKFDEFDMQIAKNRLDFHHQFTGNCLQLNNGDGTFSEIAQLAGIDATSWSWSALCFDFDNDGWKDIYVCNGLSRDLTDQDFLEFIGSKEVMAQRFREKADVLEILKKMPSVPQVNYAFVNQHNLFFKHQSAALGFTIPSFSSGAAYADLDGDGDMDLVVSNVNLESFIYRNNASENLHNHYVKIKLKGTVSNVFGYGASITIFTKDNQQMAEQSPVRGFESSVDPVINFGIGNNQQIDSIEIMWPDGKMQRLNNVKADTIIVADWKNASENIKPPAPLPNPIYKDITSGAIDGNIEHKENEYSDFDVERLIPKMLSTEGPKLAVADVNNDGLKDFFMGSALGDTARIFIQQKNGRFIQRFQQAFADDKIFENTGADFFDADNDGDMDILIVSGGNELKQGAPGLQARLYINDGKGNFVRSIQGWPPVYTNASCVRIADYNGDGKTDVFIGARNIPGSYGMPPTSFLLQNNGNNSFSDVTGTIAPSLINMGMITDAQWCDIDGDGIKELIIVGDWMPVTILKYLNGKLQKIKELPNSSGWWNCLTIADLNADGRPDLIAGNNGLNTRIKADNDHPAKLYISDFDKNGQTECIPVYFKTDGKAYPYFLKGELESQLPILKKKFLHFNEYAGKSIEEVFTAEQLKQAMVLSVVQTQSCIFINDGKGSFSMQPLPVMAQLSPAFGAIATDINGDGITDIFLAGNFYGLKPQSGRWDAGYGTSLISDGKGSYSYMPPSASGLFVRGEVRDIKKIKLNNGAEDIIVAVNNSPLHIFSVAKSKQ